MSDDETKETEEWLRRLEPRAPRPELRSLVLDACAEQLLSPWRRWWLELAAVLSLASSVALVAAADRDSRRRLDAASGPSAPTSSEREADVLMRTISLDDAALRARALAAASNRRGRTAWSVSHDLVR